MTEQAESNNWDRILAALQEALREQEEAMFSATVLDEARQPKNVGIMLDPEGYAVRRGQCGDTMEFFLRIRDSNIKVAAFMTDGCGPTLACGSRLTGMVQGMSLDEAAAIEGSDLILSLDGLPPEHIHCATLAVQTLGDALADYRQSREPVHE